MKRVLVLCLLAASTPAFAEPVRDAMVPGPELLRTQDKRRDDDGAFAGLMNAAGVGVSSGKIIFLRRNRDAVAVAVGTARLTPLFDVRFGSASALLRFTF